MSLINLIPDWRVLVLISSQASLLHHVGSANELDAHVEVQVLARADLHRDDLLHALQVALVAIHDRHTVVNVQVVGHLLSERLDSCLNKSLFSVHIKLTVATVSYL